MKRTGEEVGGYVVARWLGSGGMGTVYEAVDADGRRVALKLLHPHLSVDPVARARLRREVETLQRVRHRGVARVLDAEAESDDAFVVTELIDGVTLEEHVRDRGTLGREDLAALARGLQAAVAAIHGAGVVHRDIKPANVMLTDAGPVLIDFGISQIVEAERFTQTGMVTGTAGYLDPRLSRGESLGPEADWWSWAAVLVFAATGRPPFGQGAPATVLARAAAGDVDLVGLTAELAVAFGAALRPSGPRLAPEDLVAVLDGEVSGIAAVAALDALEARNAPTSVVAAPVVAGPTAAATTVLPRDEAGPATRVLGAVAPPTAAPAASAGPPLPSVALPASTTSPAAAPASSGSPPPPPPARVSAWAAGAPSPSAAGGPAPHYRTEAVGDPPPPPPYQGRGVGSPAYPSATVAVPPPYQPSPAPAPYSTPASANTAAPYWPTVAAPPPYQPSAPPAPYRPPGAYQEPTPYRPPASYQPPGAWGAPPPVLAALPRPGLVFVLWLVAAAFAASRPGAVILVIAAAMVLAGAVGSGSRFVRGRGQRWGRRTRDVVLGWALAPWHLLRAALVCMLAFVGGGFIAAVLWIVAWSVIPETPLLQGMAGELLEPLVTTIAVAGGIAAAWFTPSVGLVRDGAREVFAVLVPRGAPAVVVVLVALTVALLAAGSAAVGGEAPVWAPLPEPPRAELPQPAV